MASYSSSHLVREVDPRLMDSPSGPFIVDPDQFGTRLRARLFRSDGAVLIARLQDSSESADDYTDVNADGYGRVRVFRKYLMHLAPREASTGPLPLLRGHPYEPVVRTQVFQIAGCNWRCWYCFVDDDRLGASLRTASYFFPDELVAMYRAELDPPRVLDLSGGQPDLVPEWALETARSLRRRGLAREVLLWCDDNLSSFDIFNRLSQDELQELAAYPGHSRVGCFKGFDEQSFVFNTRAPSTYFSRQFDVMRKFIEAGFDMYAYATFTAPSGHCSRDLMSRFVDRLCAIHPKLPLRTVPLRIKPFTVTRSRMGTSEADSMDEQEVAGTLWTEELERRFARDELQAPYECIELRE